MSLFGQKPPSSSTSPPPEQALEWAADVQNDQTSITPLNLARLETKTAHFSEALASYRNQIFDKLINEIDLATVSKMEREELRKEIERFITEYTDETQARISYHEQQQISEDIINDMIGLGPLEVLLNDPLINDIMVNSYNTIFVERQGKLYLTDVTFRNNRHVMQISQRIANMIGRRIDESSPMVDARLEDGSRVNIIIPPVALDGISISIRKFSSKTISLDQMVRGGVFLNTWLIF